jgi:hypothetical protein
VCDLRDAVSLLKFGLVDRPQAIVSAIAGMWAGARIRLGLVMAQFRFAVLWALLLTGLSTSASRLV